MSPTLDDLLIEPRGWQLMTLAHHRDGRWYCCFRHADNRAAVAYANTAHEAYEDASCIAAEMTNG